jgi:coenzyme F420-dependent glucose-6-phosphate dehydrogenase
MITAYVIVVEYLQEGISMANIGYALSSEEHTPNDLVRQAQMAEDAGFEYALISDHFHPWIARQGHSPFVWSVIGAIAATTKSLQLGTGVTCPTVRTHPAIIAHAAATCAAMMPGRFFLGVGTGEELNEHIFGDHWPPADVRLDMLDEAVEVIRLLWKGEEVSFWGEFYTVENARLFTLPDELPPIYVAASGTNAAERAGVIGDGFITTAPDAELAQLFDRGGAGKPKFGQVTLCWAENEQEALDTVYEIWPNALIPGPLSADLPTPDHFESVLSLIKKEDLKEEMPLGPDPEKHRKAIQKYIDAGYDHVYIHQIGADQEGFIRFAEKEILPAFR